jgi:hypothetical protein
LPVSISCGALAGGSSGLSLPARRTHDPHMLAKDFDAISKSDIDALVANSVSEDRGIDYKETLPTRNDDGTKEFLADVSSFANASGGDLIFGIREHRDKDGKPDGTPDEAVGLDSVNVDDQKLRFENMIRDSIDPRIPGVRIRAIDGFSLGPVIILRVPQSWSSPHMVKFKGGSRFFSRNSAGKYPLDVREIRAAFLASEGLGDKISAFRSDRLGKILALETPVHLEPGPMLVLHLLPVRAFSEPITIDLNLAASEMNKNMLRPMGQPSFFGPTRFNFHGLYLSGGHETTMFSYLQVFRNGAIEAVSARISHNHHIIADWFESDLVNSQTFIQLQKGLGAGPPLFLGITVLSAKGLTVYPRTSLRHDYFPFIKPIEQDALVVPELMIEEEEPDFDRVLHPALDVIWQASGWSGSPGYDQSGEWKGYAT